MKNGQVRSYISATNQGSRKNAQVFFVDLFGQRAYFGGAIDVEGSATITDCTFDGNTVRQQSGSRAVAER
jgi:hypothetical protein